MTLIEEIPETYRAHWPNDSEQHSLKRVAKQVNSKMLS
jgi:hypothetical protein